jgi:hypothetical protein
MVLFILRAPPFNTALYKKGILPTLEELLSPREDTDVFQIFCCHFVACTVGRVYYKKNARNTPIRKFVTLSDEAYTQAYIENCYERWLADVKDVTEDKAGRPTYPLAKWTSAPQAATKYKGWSKPGMDRYNEIQETLKAVRKTKAAKKMEEELVERINSKATKPTKESKRAPETNAVVGIIYLDNTDSNDDEEEENE